MRKTQINFPFQDPILPTAQRVDDLLGRMDRADKVGMLFHPMIATIDPEDPGPFGQEPAAEAIRSRRIRHFNVMGAARTGHSFAEWTNAVQAVTAEHPLGIPVSLSTDPRHAFTDNPATSVLAGPFSQWPESLGLAAIGSAERVRRFADIVRQEYRAVGLSVALHPQIDLATEPRWPRAGMTFGEDAELTSRLVAAYLEGLAGGDFGAGSVSGIVKHFPGGGPQRDGTDPHFAYGREQVYPAGMFEYHLKPFIAAIAAGARQMMPYYGIPVGLEYEEVGFGFNRGILTGLLRETLGFEGIICSDWGLLTDEVAMGAPLPARAWGVEHLSVEERMLKALEAGVDQFGGESCTDVLLELVAAGRISDERIGTSVRRLLTEKFELGLFDGPYVQPDEAALVVGSAAFVEEGKHAQQDSLTLLKNGLDAAEPLLPLGRGISVYCQDMLPEAVLPFAAPVEDPAEADVAVVRLRSPFETQGEGLERLFHQGSLGFPAETLEQVRSLAEAVPTVIVVYADRPPILTEMAEAAGALVIDYGCSDSALAEVLFGEREPLGSLPFDLPLSMAAVEASSSDAPFDTEDPLFRFGDGLRYSREPAAARNGILTSDGPTSNGESA
ncbi:glycoside hydrolase family 3 protein [Sinomonas susongensis]|uniref:glycoside hydrolase family 3 protein n=1 Tax=Sinomonas susongensis TaxID=1324851 RepID=UPI0011099234|nr:glycoside hydrolase family 3 N-terminal domain-containing protein [Sinomonas susongensis]